MLQKSTTVSYLKATAMARSLLGLLLLADALVVFLNLFVGTLVALAENT